MAKDSLDLLLKFNEELNRIIRKSKKLEKEGATLVISKQKGELIVKRNVELRV